MGVGDLRYRILVALVGIGSFVSATDYTATLDTSLGRNLSPEQPGTSVSIEPDLGVKFGDSRLGLYTLIDRPTDPYEKLSVPKTVLSVNHEIPVGTVTLTPTFSSNLVSLDRWSIDGYLVRNTLSLIASKSLGALKLFLRAGVFGYVHEYTTLADGSSPTRYGLVQRLDAGYQYRRFVLKFLVVIEQSTNGSVWSNSYSTAESVGYQFSDYATLSLQHEILSSVIDSSTGFRRPLRIADGRDSRVSLVLGLEL